MQLNPAQLDAVRYTEGPCLVIAGAGSGKTRVIITKIVHLIKSGQYRPDEIAAITFTNKAAAEMRERIAQELPREVTDRLCISTFHSLGRVFLKELAGDVGLPVNFSIYDEHDVMRVLFQIVQNDYPDNDALHNRSTLQEIQNKISMWKGQLKSPAELADDPDRLCVELYRKYMNSMRLNNAVDFDDLIYLPTRILSRYPEVRKEYAKYFQYLLVDEYQDTNITQYYMMLCLAGEHGHFTVVGDDDQSIYSWRGANPENISQLSRDFPNLKVIKLEENYRSTPRILRCANTLIANNPHLFAKTLRSGIKGKGDGPKVKVRFYPHSNDMYRGVAAEIMGHQFDHRSKYSDYAVLYRSNSQARDMEKALTEGKIPCRVVGDTGFFSRSEVKDMMAWCRLISNVHDNVALLRVINIPARGIGDKTLETLNETAKYFHRSFFDCLSSSEFLIQLPAAQQKGAENFVSLLQSLKNMLRLRQDGELCDILTEKTDYALYLKSQGNSKEATERRLENISVLLGWIKDLINDKNSPCTFSEAVEKLGLREMLERDRNDDEEDDAVRLMTLHASKGLEFPYVFLIGMEEGILPHRESVKMQEEKSSVLKVKTAKERDAERNAVAGNKKKTEEEYEENPAAVEEERRLAYVGITRAQKELTVTVCHRRGNQGRTTVQTPSRFLNELPAADLIMTGPFGNEELRDEEADFDSAANIRKNIQDLL